MEICDWAPAGVRLLMNCALDDEYGLAGLCRLSPHAVGIAARILPGIRFCLRNPGG